jgi:restriction endonuclease S subunit
MERYEKYKDSGIEWIGEIPERWEVKRLKYCISINDNVLNETTNEEIEINYVEIGDVNFLSGITNSTIYKFKNAPSRARRIVKDGDVIISTVRTYLKAIAQIKQPVDNLIVSTGFAILRPKTIHSSFLGYYVLTPFFIHKTIADSVGVSYPAINSSNIGLFEAIIPSISEQIQIATYLDRKTSEIDQIIANKQKLIALYEEEKQAVINQAVTKGIDKNVKMKASGVEWLGDIPEHWEVKKIKFLTTINDETLSETTDGNYEFDYVEISDVKAGIGILSTTRYLFKDAPSRARRIIRDEDIIVSTVRTYLKSIANINYCVKDIIVSTGFAVIRPREINSDYRESLKTTF